ncbi:MAG: LacI family transcriptional regulator [Cephaloticoccus sp.]|nr:LacI family transcriptional regulator [Cephaloticoccus sp.]MCF7760245.1 LacI family transcriptional regulator [Cephaloticoccus sp.]
MGTPPPTMQDVAKAAGVARSTVSLALRNDRSIPPSTRSRIFAAAEKLGYKTNPLVSALMTSLHDRRTKQRHLVLAYVTTDPEVAPWRSYRMFIELQQGAKTRAEELGYRLEEFALRSPGMTPKRYTQMLQARGILGMLIAPLPLGEHTIELDFTDFAVVGIDMSVGDPPIERVSNDHFQSALLAVRECHALGYKRIGFIVSQQLNERLDHRWISACHLAQADMPAKQRVKPLMPPATDDILPAIPAWYASEKPDVVIMSELNPYGHYPLPPEVGMVSLGIEEQSLGQVAGIFQDNRRLGAIAIEHLVARLERAEFNTDDRGRLHMLAGKWFAGPTAPGLGQVRQQLI